MEHLKRNMYDKLIKLDFPSRRAKIISDNIPNALYYFNNEKELDNELEEFRE